MEENFCTENGHEDYVKEYCQLCYSKKLRVAKQTILKNLFTRLEADGWFDVLTADELYEMKKEFGIDIRTEAKPHREG